MENKFDIYSVAEFSLAEPRFSRVCTVDPVMRAIGNHAAADADGYLGVALLQLEALWVVKVLRRMGIQAYPVEVRYKSSSISVLEAKRVAQEFIREKQALKPEYEFAGIEETPIPWWLSKIAYGFFSKSEKMMREGILPAGITVCVDRVSGQILQERELMHAELPIMLTE